MPSQWLDIPADDLDRDAERAFVLASIQKHDKDEKKAREKAEKKAKANRKGRRR